MIISNRSTVHIVDLKFALFDQGLGVAGGERMGHAGELISKKYI